MLSKVLYFAVGAAIGSAATYFVVKTKYEELANQERIEREEYHKRMKEIGDKFVEGFENGIDSVDPETVESYKDLASDYFRSEESGEVNMLDYYRKKVEERNKKKEEEEDMTYEHYVISPEEFGEVGYNEVSLTYYADGVLTDEHDKEISEDGIERLIGKESLKHFGEYEDDSVFVRNDKLHTDYEILKDLRNYYE